MKIIFYLSLLIFSFSMIGNAQTITFDKSLLAGTATQVLETDGGGYLLYCASNPQNGSKRITFLKTDQFGFTEWVKYYTGILWQLRINREISKTFDGGYVAIASKKNGLLADVYVMKFDQNLDTMWAKTYGNQDQQEFGHAIIQLPDSSLIFSSRDASYVYLRKTNKNGDLIWNKSTGSTIVSWYQTFLVNIYDGTFLLYTNTINSTSLVKMNADADTIWTRTAAGIKNCSLTNDGFILLSTSTYLQKLDLDGNLLWQKSIANVISSTQSSNGNYVLLKDGNNILETDTSGNILSSTPIEYSGSFITATEDGGFAISGNNNIYNSQYEDNYTWFRKTDNSFNYNAINLKLPADGDRLKIFETYPIIWKTNNADFVNIDYSVDNQVSWNNIIHYYPAASDTFFWTLPEMPSGNLFIRISDSFNPDLYDRSDPPQKAVNYNSFDYIAANEIQMWQRNDGENSHNYISDVNQPPGFLWPGGENATLPSIFIDGLVWGGKVNGEIRVNGNTYRAGLIPGYILPSGLPSDPYETKDKLFRLKKNWQYLPPGPERSKYEFDYLNWPVDLGAPWDDNDGDGVYTLGIDNPRILGEETLFFVANDLDTSRSTFTYGSNPIGLELQATTFGYNSELLKDVVFKKFKIINKSPNEIIDMYLTYWADDDLGNANDDYVGCDTLLNLAYAYNGDNNDEGNYGTPPPAVGHLIVQPPIVQREPTDSARYGDGWKKGFRNIPVNSFVLFINSSEIYQDPYMGLYEGTLQFYNIMQGFLWDGSPIIDPNTNLPTHFCLAGDPVTGTGWYEGNGWPGGEMPGDRRYALTSGPFNMAPNDTQEVAIAFLMKKGTDNINSITELKNYAAQIQHWYDNDFVTDVEESKSIFPLAFSLSQNYPNPFNPSTIISWQSPVGSWQTLKVYDVLGNEVATLVNEERPAGNYEVQFDGSKFASGVYFYQLKAGSFIQTKKMVLIK
ncbi:MAG: T9SS type A sorting domain-containing protein [Ignavibacteria bacterium]|nr:T9SS type A sorting domain-containing protein [Ignavibacteria bacterium]